MTFRRTMKLIFSLKLLCATVFGGRRSNVFVRRDNKRLDTDRIDSVSFSSLEQCLGVCLHDKRCKSFNADNENCELLAEDRCSVNRTLTESIGSNYFDTVPDGKCLPGKRFHQVTFCSLPRLCGLFIKFDLIYVK